MTAHLRLLDVADPLRVPSPPDIDAPRPPHAHAHPVRAPDAGARRVKLRFVMRKLHLYITLWCGLLFMVLGLTGTALAWMHEIDSALNPELFHATPSNDAGLGGAARLQVVVDFLAADPLYGRPDQLQLPAVPGEVFVASYRAKRSGEPSAFELNVTRQVMVDPVALRVTGERNWGESGLSARLLMPTLFHVHRYMLAGEVGKTIIGISGLLMLIVALSGLVLWWPKLRLKALRQALTVSYHGSWPRFNYSLHRAAGFFAAPVLIVLGFSGLYLNLPQWVLPLVGTVLPLTPPAKLGNAAPQVGAPIDAQAALRIAQARFPEARVGRVAMGSPKRPYEVRLRQEGEVRKGDGATRVSIDAYSGALLRVRDPLHANSGDTFLNWLFPLHTGEAFGSAGRVIISVFGIAPMLFMITGVAIWLKRRPGKARH